MLNSCLKWFDLDTNQLISSLFVIFIYKLFCINYSSNSIYIIKLIVFPCIVVIDFNKDFAWIMQIMNISIIKYLIILSL